MEIAETDPTMAGNDAKPWEDFPKIDLRQLQRMTDDTGLFQHALYSMPDPKHGYCIDDNARALIAALLHSQLRGYDERVVPLHRYLTFLAYAFNEDRRRFRNFMSYDRRWLEEEGSQDSQGRAIWALGLAVSMAPTDSVRELAQNLFQKALAAIEDFQYLRSWAFALIGLEEYLKKVDDDEGAKQLRDRFACKLFDAYQSHATDDWPWWEDLVTYDNAKLPHALLISGKAMQRYDMMGAALKSLKWLIRMQTADSGESAGGRWPVAGGGKLEGHLSIIGNQGWLRKGSSRAKFDQQPLEAYAMVHGCLTAANITGESTWADLAWWCFEWFRGRNDMGVPLYHSETGGCQDGLGESGPNKNQGAESILAYLLSVLELHVYRESRLGRITITVPQAIGYAIVGGSQFADICLAQYTKIEGLKPVGVWNQSPQRANEIASQYNLKVYGEINDLLADTQIDLIHVASNPGRHAEHALAAISRGKHVLCEKTIATSSVDGERILEAAAHQDLCVAVDFVMRYGPLAQTVSQIIASQILGSPLRGMYINLADDSGLPEDHWFWDETESGGIFVEHGVHFFDLVRSWLGEGVVLSAHRLRRPATDLIDQVSCDVRYGQQTTVGFYYGFHQSQHLQQQDFRLVCERGRILLNGWVAHEMTINAVLSEQQIESLQAMIPDARLKTLRRIPDTKRIIYRRRQQETVDREIELIWRYEQDDSSTYNVALRLLMEDVIQTVKDRHYKLRATAKDGQEALKVALEADRIARGVTP